MLCNHWNEMERKQNGNKQQNCISKTTLHEIHSIVSVLMFDDQELQVVWYTTYHKCQIDLIINGQVY